MSILQLKGGVYLINRADVEASEPGAYIADAATMATRQIARLEMVLRAKMQQELQVGRKGDDAPTWARNNGDSLEIQCIFADLTDSLIGLATNNRNDGGHFRPGDLEILPNGHRLKDENYTAILIADEEDPLNKPALYIPFTLCYDFGWLAFSDIRHTEVAELTMISMAVAGDGWPPYEYGDDITKFKNYVEAE